MNAARGVFGEKTPLAGTLSKCSLSCLTFLSVQLLPDYSADHKVSSEKSRLGIMNKNQCLPVFKNKSTKIQPVSKGIGNMIESCPQHLLSSPPVSMLDSGGCIFKCLILPHTLPREIKHWGRGHELPQAYGCWQDVCVTSSFPILNPFFYVAQCGQGCPEVYKTWINGRYCVTVSCICKSSHASRDCVIQYICIPQENSKIFL